MPGLYSATIFLVWASLAVLSVLVRENGRIPREDKWRFYLAYFLIAISSAAEWVGVQLNGNMQIPQEVLLAVKTMDYICTPLAGAAIVAPMKPEGAFYKAMLGILAFNTVFQLTSAFVGGMVVINLDHYYSHGPWYMIYMMVYIAILILVIIEFAIYSRAFKRRNQLALWSIMALVFAGIAAQEVLGSDYRIAYLSITIGAAMLFIHYVEFSQIASDERIEWQKKQLATDNLTHVRSRVPYSEALHEYDDPEKVPESMAVFLVDINGLKKVNDAMGHDAGDELICGAAECVSGVFDGRGEVYRIGGDEFVIICDSMNREEAEGYKAILANVAGQWTGVKAEYLSLSSGFALASEHRDLSLARLIRVADQRMYAEKEEYYREHNLHRRLL